MLHYNTQLQNTTSSTLLAQHFHQASSHLITMKYQMLLLCLVCGKQGFHIFSQTLPRPLGTLGQIANLIRTVSFGFLKSFFFKKNITTFVKHRARPSLNNKKCRYFFIVKQGSHPHKGMNQ